MPEQYHHARQVDHPEVAARVQVPADGHAAEVLQPGVQAHHLPPTPVAAQRPPVLRRRRHAALSVGRDHLDALRGQFRVQWVAVVRPIADPAMGQGRHEPRRQRPVDQRHLVGRGLVDVGSNGQSAAVGDQHQLGALAPLGLPDGVAPFLAGAKVPSMKHSERSGPACWAKAWTIFFRVSSLTHLRNLRRQVW